MRESISSEERLAATLRYLATGRSFQDGISPSSLCHIIPEPCKVIYQILKQTYLKVSMYNFYSHKHSKRT